MKPTRFHWKRVVGEATLIVATVFLAISLESIWQERSDVAEARVALAQILRELRADREFSELVLAEQEMVGDLHSDLLNWFADPESLPADLVHEALRKLNNHGLTMWPRRAAWTTMVAAGQLRLLGDSELVARLGDYYEHRQQRLSHNGQAYDAAKWSFDSHLVPELWDSQRRKLLTDDPVHIVQFRNQIVHLKIWNQWYLTYMADDYRKDLSALIYEVEEYLLAHGNAIE